MHDLLRALLVRRSARRHRVRLLVLPHILIHVGILRSGCVELVLVLLSLLLSLLALLVQQYKY
jgi:hypothetical protein